MNVFTSGRWAEQHPMEIFSPQALSHDIWIVMPDLANKKKRTNFFSGCTLGDEPSALPPHPSGRKTEELYLKSRRMRRTFGEYSTNIQETFGLNVYICACLLLLSSRCSADMRKGSRKRHMKDTKPQKVPEIAVVARREPRLSTKVPCFVCFLLST